MKRRRFFPFLLAAIAAVLVIIPLSSCGSDDEEPQDSPLMGAWLFTEDATTSQALQQVIGQVMQQQQWPAEALQVLSTLQGIVERNSFVVQIVADHTARIYSYYSGVGTFITAQWAMPQEGTIVFTVGSLQLPVTDLQISGTTLHCSAAGLPLTFTRYR